MDFQGLLDTGSEFVQIPKHPKKHCGPPLKQGVRRLMEFWLTPDSQLVLKLIPWLFPTPRMDNWDRYTQKLAEFSRYLPDLWSGGYYDWKDEMEAFRAASALQTSITSPEDRRKQYH